MQWCFRFPVSAFPLCLRFDHIKMKFNPRQKWRVSYHTSDTLHHSQVTTGSYFTHWPIPPQQWSMGGTWVVMMPPLGFYLYWDKIGKRQKKHTLIFAAESLLNCTLHGQSATAYTIYYWSFSFNSNWKHLPDIIDSLGIKHTRCNTSASGAAALIGAGNFWSLSKYFTFNRIIWSFSN